MADERIAVEAGQRKELEQTHARIDALSRSIAERREAILKLPKFQQDPPAIMDLAFSVTQSLKDDFNRFIEDAAAHRWESVDKKHLLALHARKDEIHSFGQTTIYGLLKLAQALRAFYSGPQGLVVALNTATEPEQQHAGFYQKSGNSSKNIMVLKGESEEEPLDVTPKGGHPNFLTQPLLNINLHLKGLERLFPALLRGGGPSHSSA